MSANARRGEVDAVLDEKPMRLCLTLGALAELESAFGLSDLSALVERFSTGRLAANDLLKLIGAGLRAGGHAVSDAEVAAMRHERGAAGFADIAARLLEATFGSTERTANPQPPQTATTPFPGTMS